MGGPVTPKDMALAAIAIIAAFFVTAILPLIVATSWVILLLSFAGITRWPVPLDKQTLIVYFFVSFAVVCATLWLSAQVEIVRLKEDAQKVIGRAFVVTALGALVAGFSKLIK